MLISKWALAPMLHPVSPLLTLQLSSPTILSSLHIGTLKTHFKNKPKNNNNNKTVLKPEHYTYSPSSNSQAFQKSNPPRLLRLPTYSTVQPNACHPLPRSHSHQCDPMTSKSTNSTNTSHFLSDLISL